MSWFIALGYYHRYIHGYLWYIYGYYILYFAVHNLMAAKKRPANQEGDMGTSVGGAEQAEIDVSLENFVVFTPECIHHMLHYHVHL